MYVVRVSINVKTDYVLPVAAGAGCCARMPGEGPIGTEGRRYRDPPRLHAAF